MFSYTRAGPEDSTPRGLVLRGVFGSRAPRAVGGMRALFVAVWLIYVIQPLKNLFGHHHGALYIGGAVAITAVYCAVFFLVVAAPHLRRAVPVWRVAPLFALAALACVVYDGANWNVLWIYVSASCGLVLADRRAVAVRAVLAAGACFVVFSWIGHDGASDLLITLLPVLLVGFAMIGFRMQIEMTRELTAARETVAQLAANQERLRLARDVHDLTGQSLSMITLKSELAARLLTRLPESREKDRVREEIDQVAAVSRQTLHDIREAVSGYRRPTLAVEIITARTALDAAGITAHDDADITLLSGRFDPDAEAALAWCLREAVTNVIRHSGATNCHISLIRRARTLSLTVEDDGRGPARSCGPAAACAGTSTGTSGGTSTGTSTGTSGDPSSGTGLHSMSERLSALDGDLGITAGPDGGFRLTATVPVKTGATVTT
jgi:two-component system, NarL family, sensor histidine kinase DesK